MSRRTPELPKVVVVTGTGLSSTALHIDAKWSHVGADHRAKATPPNTAKAPPRTGRRPAARAHVRGVNDTSRGGKYHNKREFVALAGELGLAWPDGQRPHPVIGFSDVQLTETPVADSAATLAYLDAAIRLYRNTFRRLGLLGGQEKGQGGGEAGRDGDGTQPTGKTSERFKVVW